MLPGVAAPTQAAHGGAATDASTPFPVLTGGFASHKGHVAVPALLPSHYDTPPRIPSGPQSAPPRADGAFEWSQRQGALPDCSPAGFDFTLELDGLDARLGSLRSLVLSSTPPLPTSPSSPRNASAKDLASLSRSDTDESIFRLGPNSAPLEMETAFKDLMTEVGLSDFAHDLTAFDSSSSSPQQPRSNPPIAGKAANAETTPKLSGSASIKQLDATLGSPFTPSLPPLELSKSGFGLGLGLDGFSSSVHHAPPSRTSMAQNQQDITTPNAPLLGNKHLQSGDSTPGTNHFSPLPLTSSVSPKSVGSRARSNTTRFTTRPFTLHADLTSAKSQTRAINEFPAIPATRIKSMVSPLDLESATQRSSLRDKTTVLGARKSVTPLMSQSEGLYLSSNRGIGQSASQHASLYAHVDDEVATSRVMKRRSNSVGSPSVLSKSVYGQLIAAIREDDKREQDKALNAILGSAKGKSVSAKHPDFSSHTATPIVDVSTVEGRRTGVSPPPPMSPTSEPMATSEEPTPSQSRRQSTSAGGDGSRSRRGSLTLKLPKILQKKRKNEPVPPLPVHAIIQSPIPPTPTLQQGEGPQDPQKTIKKKRSFGQRLAKRLSLSNLRGEQDVEEPIPSPPVPSSFLTSPNLAAWGPHGSPTPSAMSNAPPLSPLAEGAASSTSGMSAAGDSIFSRALEPPSPSTDWIDSGMNSPTIVTKPELLRASSPTETRQVSEEKLDRLSQPSTPQPSTSRLASPTRPVHDTLHFESPAKPSRNASPWKSSLPPPRTISQRSLQAGSIKPNLTLQVNAESLKGTTSPTSAWTTSSFLTMESLATSPISSLEASRPESSVYEMAPAYPEMRPMAPLNHREQTWWSSSPSSSAPQSPPPHLSRSPARDASEAGGSSHRATPSATGYSASSHGHGSGVESPPTDEQMASAQYPISPSSKHRIGQDDDSSDSEDEFRSYVDDSGGASDSEDGEDADSDSDNVPLASLHPDALAVQKKLQADRDKRHAKRKVTRQEAKQSVMAKADALRQAEARARVQNEVQRVQRAKLEAENAAAAAAKLVALQRSQETSVSEDDDDDDDDRPLVFKQQVAPLQAPQPQSVRQRPPANPPLRNPFAALPEDLAKRLQQVQATQLKPSLSRSSSTSSIARSTVGHALLPQTDASVLFRKQSAGATALQPLSQFIQESVLTMDDDNSPAPHASHAPNPLHRAYTTKVSSSLTNPIQRTSRKAAMDPVTSANRSELLRKPTRHTPPTPQSIPVRPPPTVKPQTESNVMMTKSSSSPSSQNGHANSVLQRVAIGDQTRTVLVDVDESTKPRHVLRMIEAKGELRSETGKGGEWGLFEVWQDLGIERPIREIESISSVVDTWIPNSDNAYLLAKRSSLSSIAISNRAMTSGTFGGYLWCELKPGKWSKRFVVLRDNNIYLCANDKGKDEVFLCTLASHDAFLVTPTGQSHLRAPRGFAFGIKSLDKLSFFESKADFAHFFCTKEEDVVLEWIRRIYDARTFRLMRAPPKDVPEVVQRLQAKRSVHEAVANRNVTTVPTSTVAIRQGTLLAEDAARAFRQGTLLGDLDSQALAPMSALGPGGGITSHGMTANPSGRSNEAAVGKTTLLTFDEGPALGGLLLERSKSTPRGGNATGGTTTSNVHSQGLGRSITLDPRQRR